MRLALVAVIAMGCGTPKAASRDSSAPLPASDDAGSATPIEPASEAPISPVPPPPPVAPAPAAPPVAAYPNPDGCPASPPNINASCDKNGLTCTYGPSCGGPVYVCARRKFEARFTSCPK